MSHEYLFRKAAMFAVIQTQTEVVKKEVQGIPADIMLNTSEQDLVRSIVQKFRLEIPSIREADIYIAHSGETRVDVSGDPMRLLLDRSRPFYVAGTETIIAVPFDGDPDFFRIQPQTHSLNPPRAEITQNELLLRYVRTDQNGEAIKHEYQRTVASINDHLRSLSESAAPFNAQLEGLVTNLVKQRKERLVKDAAMTDAIGLPLKRR